MTPKYATRKLTQQEKSVLAERPQHLATVQRRAADAPIPQTPGIFKYCSPIKNQLSEGACTGEAAIKLVEFWELFYGVKPFVPRSVQFNYNMSLKLQNELGKDAGSTVPIALSVPVTYGAPPESLYPYDANGDALQMPPQNVIDAALLFKAKNAELVIWPNQTPSQAIMEYMSKNKVPLSVSMGVTSMLFNPINGVVDVGGVSYPEEGHDMACFDWEMDPNKPGKVRFIYAQSWGEEFGIAIPPFTTGGYIYITEDYIDENATGAGAEYYDRPAEQPFTLTASFAEPSVPIGTTNNLLTVKTALAGKPVANQAVNWSQSRPGMPAGSDTGTWITGTNGEWVGNPYLTEAGTITVNLSWDAPDGVTRTATAKAEWGAQPTPKPTPVPTPVTTYELTAGPFATQAQAQLAAKQLEVAYEVVTSVKAL